MHFYIKSYLLVTDQLQQIQTIPIPPLVKKTQSPNFQGGGPCCLDGATSGPRAPPIHPCLREHLLQETTKETEESTVLTTAVLGKETDTQNTWHLCLQQYAIDSGLPEITPNFPSCISPPYNIFLIQIHHGRGPFSDIIHLQA